MKKWVKDYWFIFVCGLFVLVFFLFSVVVALAPHVDMKQRGFTPCTYQMLNDFNKEEKLSFTQTVSVINKGYICYAGVVWQGMKMFFKGEQKTPWTNYLFEPELESIPFAAEGEPYPEDLIKANMLDESMQNTDLLRDDIKEKTDDKE